MTVTQESGSATTTDFVTRFRGAFSGVLRWEKLDSLWQTLRTQGDKQWYIYAVGESPPSTPVSAAQLDTFLVELDGLLRKEHDEDYCGIVYADELSDPTFIKIYDPGNLGVVCGFSDNPPLPGWILSLEPPVDLEHALPQTGNRRRWWTRIFGTKKHQ
ncbi:MAG TPA: hypothetical protein ENJ01_08695 [Gammaproteobacteria bacterium]|nr:hypothetical protein [Gammaproteobacteria bacterium]